jgi:hypothetical protein
MSWFFGTKKLPEAVWSIENTPRGYSGKKIVGLTEETAVEIWPAWVLRDAQTRKNIIGSFAKKIEYDQELPNLKKYYSFPDLTPENWRMLIEKHELAKTVYKEHNNYTVEKGDASVALANGVFDADAAAEKEKCKRLLATGGRKKTKKGRRKTNKKKSRRHR